jgi:hypothetical protein
MNIKKIIKEFKYSFIETKYDSRKVENSVDIIKLASDMGYTYAKISKICGVSKPTISNWGNINKKDKPSVQQIRPLVEEMGAGRIPIKAEELPEAAREYPPFYSNLPLVVMVILALTILWLVIAQPCINDWGGCKKLPWYKMPTYISLKIKGRTEEFNKWKNDAALIEEFHQWKADAPLIAEFKAWKKSIESDSALQDN